MDKGEAQHGVPKVSQMQKKYGKFYADWDDEHGKRHRKALPTKKRALKFQRAQRNRVAQLKAPAPAPSANSARRGARVAKRARRVQA